MHHCTPEPDQAAGHAADGTGKERQGLKGREGTGTDRERRRRWERKRGREEKKGVATEKGEEMEREVEREGE